MHIAFIMELDKATLSNMPSFDPAQIDYFLNSAYLMKINQKLTGHNTIQQGFEANTKRISDLQKLIKTAIINIEPRMVHAPNEFSANLQEVSDFMYPVSSMVNDLTDSIFESTVISTHEESYNMRLTTQNKPWIPVPVTIYGNNRVLIYVDPDKINDFTTKDYSLVLTYIKRPERLDFYSTSGNTFIPEISEHVHPEIVSLAVSLAVENIESQRVQTYPNINETNRE